MITAADLNLIAKHSGDQASFEANEAIFRSLSAAAQAAVVNRLRALDEYLSLPEQTSSEAARLAATLGTSERNFYRLVAKLRERGPVAGLAPSYRVKQRSSAATDGLGEVADISLERLLQGMPDASLRDAIVEVEEACRQAGIPAPSSGSIRRRLLVLRAEARHRQDKRFFGEKWLMDQSAISLKVAEGAEVRYAVATLLVDQRTRLIAGAGCVSQRSPESGVVSALEDALVRMPGLAEQPLNVAVRPRDYTWVVPEGMTGLGFRPVFAVSTTSSLGPRRHGERLLRLIGGKLGPFSLLIRSTAEPFVLLDLLDERDTPPVDYGKALEVIRHSAHQWNQSISEVYPQEKRGRGAAARRARLRDIAAAIVDHFLPALPPSSAAVLENLKDSVSRTSGTARPDERGK